MFFRQILHEDLGCASYGIAAGGEAAVVDPKWEIEEYLKIAEGNGFRISHLLETHNHADKPVAVACSAGNRSSIAASLLRRAGLHGIEHLADGDVADLQGEGVELAREE